LKKRVFLNLAGWNPDSPRVGFDRRFGVKLGVLWALESGLPLMQDGSKHFK
jgi:hypothetical protein